MAKKYLKTTVTVKDIADFYEAYPECNRLLFAKTRHGYRQILAAGITAYASPVIKLIVDTGVQKFHRRNFVFRIGAAPSHQLMTGEQQWIKVEDLTVGQMLLTERGEARVTSIRKQTATQDLYDLQIEGVHEFYANGFVSHNSTFLDALCYGLYKKPFRKVNKLQLVNSINGADLLIEIDFEIGTHQYRVRRGIKPDIFELSINGKRRPQEAAKKDDQTFLEEDLLKVGFDSFTQIVILGNAKYTPFMKLTTPARRVFIENILDIGVFSTMNELLSERYKTNKTFIDNADRDITVTQEQITLVAGFIGKLESEEKKSTEDLARQLADQIDKIKNAECSIERLNPEIEQVHKVVTETTKRIKDAADVLVLAIQKTLATASECLEKHRTSEVSRIESQMKADVSVHEATTDEEIKSTEGKLSLDTDIELKQIIETAPLEANLYKSNGHRNGIQNNLAAAQNKVEFYRNTTSCDACGQEIAESHRNTVIEAQTLQAAEYADGLVKIQDKIAGLTERLIEAKATNKATHEIVRKLTLAAGTKISQARANLQQVTETIRNAAQDQIREINSSTALKTKCLHGEATKEREKIAADLTNEIHEKTLMDEATIVYLEKDKAHHMSVVATANAIVMKLKTEMKKTPGNLTEQKTRLVEFENALAGLEQNRAEAIETRHFYDMAAILLKDSGIKAAIIKQYLPVINRLVNKYLGELELFLSFQMDEAFSESFKSRHLDALQYNSFSEGEKLRIDLALLFAWRDVARMKNSCATNLLALDEVIDSSLDQNGTEVFIRMLSKLGMESNVFVISHKNDSALDRFQNIIRFEKRQNFSHVVKESVAKVEAA